MYLGNQDFIWISLQMPCLVFSMSLLSFFLKNPRGETAEVTASTWATFRKCGSRKRFKALGRKQGRFSVQGFFGTTEISLTNGEKPTQNDPKLKNSCVKQFFSYNHLHFVSFYLFCVADSSTHIQNISGQFAPCHPYHLPTVTRFSWNDLRSLIRKKIVSNLCQSCWSGKSIPSCRDNCVSKSELFIWVFPKIGVPPNHPSYIIGFSIINHPFWGTTIFGNTQIKTVTDYKYDTFCLWNMTSCPTLVILYNNLGDE